MRLAHACLPDKTTRLWQGIPLGATNHLGKMSPAWFWETTARCFPFFVARARIVGCAFWNLFLWEAFHYTPMAFPPEHGPGAESGPSQNDFPGRMSRQGRNPPGEVRTAGVLASADGAGYIH